MIPKEFLQTNLRGKKGRPIPSYKYLFKIRATERIEYVSRIF